MRKMVFLLLVVACLLPIEVNMTAAVSTVKGVEDNILYAGKLTSPGRVVKIDLTDFQIVNRMTLNAGEDRIHALGITDQYLYAGLLGEPAQLIQIRLSDFTRVNKVVLDGLRGIVTIKKLGSYLYVSGGRLRLYRLNPDTLQIIDYVDISVPYERGIIIEDVNLAGGYLYLNVEVQDGYQGWAVKLLESDLSVIDIIQLSLKQVRLGLIDGNYLYVVSNADPAGLMKIDLITFREVGAVTFGTPDYPWFPDGDADFIVKYGDYFYTNADNSPKARVHKVRIADFTWVGALDLTEARACDIELSEHYLYVSTVVSPSKIIKVDLDTFQEVAKLDTGEGWIVQMAIIPKAEAPPPPTEFITITGIVTKEKKGEPMIGALVRADGYSNTTDSAGRYALMVPPGIYTVTASAPGYKESSQIVDARIKGTYRVNLTLATSDDNIPPRISNITIQPSYPTPHDEVAVTCAVTDDESGVKEVTLYYSTDGEVDWTRVSMTYVGDLYKATIPRQKEGITVQYFVEALDNSLNREKSSISSYTIKAPGETLPGKETTVGLIVFIFVISIVVWFVSKRRRPLKFSSYSHWP